MSGARKFAAYGLPPLAVAALIFFLSSQQSIDAPTFPGSDKVAHLCIYGLLGFLNARALFGYGHVRAARWGGALLAIAYGATDELHQRFVPGRMSDPFDLVADALGAIVGASVFVYLALRRAAP